MYNELVIEKRGMEMQIGEIAKLADVNIQTIRFYERRKLIRPAARRESGYRLYDENSLRQIRFIKEAQALGFSLAEIRTLLGLRVRSAKSCDSVKERAQQKLISVREKIESLQKMELALTKLIEECEHRTASDCCPFLK